MAKLFEEGFTQNREISWLRYNERVLEEAFDETVPLFERLNFISIFTSNLEEFFQVRVGSLISDDENGDDSIDIKSGMNPAEQLEAIYEMIPKLLARKDEAYRLIDSELKAKGLNRLSVTELRRDEAKKAADFFKEKIRDRISPIIIKADDEFPMLESNKPYILSRLESSNDGFYAIAEIPSDVEKILVFDEGIHAGGEVRYIVTEDLVKTILPQLFSPFKPVETVGIAITRNGDVPADTDSKNMLKEMKSVVERRRTTDPDMLIVDTKLSSRLEDYLLSVFDLAPSQVYIASRTSYSYISDVRDIIPEWLNEKLCYEAFTPFNQLKLRNRPVMEIVKEEDILSSYPYDSMDPFLELLREASTHKKVKEIRMTIYRLSSHPIIVEHLLEAVKNGKKVKVLIELRARFDEERNIDWAEKLSEAGCKVYYGDEKYKVHSKLCQIVIDDGDDKKYISQVSTGNYNEKSAKLYTDFSLITYDQRIGKDVDDFFEDVFKNKEGEYKHILTSPKTMQDTLVKLIRREADKGKDGRIFIKVNSVTDVRLIEELMEASCKGCVIRMIVRGICCILPGIEYCTENISVVNVVGRFLEHSRVYVFGEGEDEVMYIASADLMTRNMTKRVELACPVYNTSLRNRIKAVLYLNYIDNVKGRVLTSDGTYKKKPAGNKKTDSQQMLMKQSQVV
ncbi:MAG: polyphosphate kinase 1 [Clostridiales bacterium]|nr:polyphosphate kinase 1 [Candidatus Crickella merdequi]